MEGEGVDGDGAGVVGGLACAPTGQPREVGEDAPGARGVEELDEGGEGEGVAGGELREREGEGEVVVEE